MTILSSGSAEPQPEVKVPTNGKHQKGHQTLRTRNQCEDSAETGCPDVQAEARMQQMGSAKEVTKIAERNQYRSTELYDVALTCCLVSIWIVALFLTSSNFS